MKPGPFLAALTLHSTIELGAAPRSTLDWLTELIEKNRWTGSSISAREQAEKWDAKFQQRLRNDLDQLNRLGRFCTFAFNSSDQSLLQGGAFVEPIDSDGLKKEKALRSRFGLYVNQLRNLTPRELEKLCAGLLSLLNVESAQMTRYSADRGVDFYGQLSIGQQLFRDETFPHWHRQLKTWLIGQAKHYVDGTVSTPALRDIVGTVHLLKGPLADRRPYPSLVIRSCDPVFMLLVTTGRLSRDVWDEIDRSGAVGIDGEMLASFLASRSVGCRGGVFDSMVFRDWLSSFDPAPLEADESSDDFEEEAAVTEPT